MRLLAATGHCGLEGQALLLIELLTFPDKTSLVAAGLQEQRYGRTLLCSFGVRTTFFWNRGEVTDRGQG